MENAFRPRYRLERLLGSGAESDVFLAHDFLLDRRVALKRFRRGAGSPSYLRKEFSLLSDLNHPHIVRVYDLQAAEGEEPFLTMDYLQGPDLRGLQTALCRKAEGGEGEDAGRQYLLLILRTLCRIASALRYLHSRGVLHGDLKPSNVIYCRGAGEGPPDPEDLRLVDFSLSRAFGRTGKGDFSGTFRYSSPEQILGRKLDGRSDLFSLGVLFYELLTNRHPYEGFHPYERHWADMAAEGLIPPSWQNRLVPPDLDRIVRRLLQVDPSRRYQEAGDLIADLHSALPARDPRWTPVPDPCFSFHAGLAGRKGVFRRIHRRVREGVRRGEGSGIVVLGRLGAGKNRLVRTVRQRCKAESLLTVSVSCISHGRGVSALMGEILRQFRLLPGCVVGDRGGSPALPINPGASTGFPPARIPPEEWERGKEARWDRFAKVFSGFSRDWGGWKGAGLLVVIEHLEAASPEARDFLLYLFPKLQDRPIVFLCTCGTDGVQGRELSRFLRLLPAGSRVELKDLGYREVRQVLADHFGPVPGLDRFARGALSRTMGNVALLEEYVSHCLRQEVIRRVPSGWVLDTARLAGIPVSRSLEAAMLRRFRALGRRSRRFLGVLSVLDHGWEEGLLGMLFRETFPDWRACLRDLVRHGLLCEEEREDGGDVLYRLVLPRLRRRFSGEVEASEAARFHRRWAGLLEARMRRDPALLHRVAEHYRLAGDRRRAVHYLVQEGEHLLRDRDLAGAERSFLSALGLRPSAPVLMHLLRRSGELAYLKGDYPRGLGYFRRLAAREKLPPDGPHSRGEVCSRISEGYERLGRLREAERFIRKALEEVRRTGVPAATIPVQATLGWIAFRRGRIQEAERRLSEATCSARFLADGRLLAELELKRGALFLAIGKAREAEQSYRRCLAIAKKRRDLGSELKCYNGLGAVCAERDPFRAEEFLRKGEVLAEKVGARRIQGSLLTNLGRVLRCLGRWEEARGACEKAGRILRDLGVSEEARPLLLLGNLYRDRREYGRARRYYRRAGSACRKGGPASTRVLLRVNLSILHEMMGNLGQASRALGKCRGWIPKAGSPAGGAYLLQAARLNLLQNRFSGAGRFLSLARPLLRSAGSLSLGMQENLLRGEILLRAGRGDPAGRKFDFANRMSRRLGSPDPARAGVFEWNRFKPQAGIGESPDGNAGTGVEAGPGEPADGPGFPGRSLFRSAPKTGGQPAMMDSDTICQVLYELAGLCRSFHDAERLPDRILKFTLCLSGAERGFIFLRDEAGGELRLVASRRPDRETVTDALEISQSILQGTLRRDFPTYSTNALQDRRFKDAESVLKYKIRSFICAPMKSEERIIGTIYLDHKTTRKVFGEKDAKLLFAIATFVAPVFIHAGRTGRLEDRVKRLEGEVSDLFGLENIIRRSRKMREVYRLVEKVKDTDASVLLLGESGTGKELLARTIHYQGSRGHGPFVPVNCAAIPETLIESELFGVVPGAATGVRERRGKFEEANGGTIFLDEIADLSLNSQAKILRTLQERSIERVGSNVRVPLDVRIISATNRDLKTCLTRGEFREDLYFRLNVIPIHIPPLRERQEDIPLLMAHFVEFFSRSLHKPFLQIPKETVRSYQAYPWPGNVREIRSVIEREVILAEGKMLPPLERGSRIEDIFSESIEGALGRSYSEDALTREYTRKVLARLSGNKRRACEVLGIDFKTLQKRIGTLGPPGGKPGTRARKPGLKP